MFEWFLDIFNILFALVFSLIGIIIGFILYRYLLPRRNQILYCRERDGRAMELNVQEEDAISLETSTKPPLRFFKFGRSYEFVGRLNRTFTRFFGKEGTAYTWRLQGFSTKQSANPGTVEPQKVELTYPTLEEAVKFRWGKRFYETVPEERQEELRDDKVLLTVNLEPGIVPEGYEPITESTVLMKADEDAAELWAKSIQGAIKQGFIDKVPWILAGAGILAIVSKLFGWW